MSDMEGPIVMKQVLTQASARALAAIRALLPQYFS